MPPRLRVPGVYPPYAERISHRLARAYDSSHELPYWLLMYIEVWPSGLLDSHSFRRLACNGTPPTDTTTAVSRRSGRYWSRPAMSCVCTARRLCDSACRVGRHHHHHHHAFVSRFLGGLAQDSESLGRLLMSGVKVGSLAVIAAVADNVTRADGFQSTSDAQEEDRAWCR